MKIYEYTIERTVLEESAPTKIKDGRTVYDYAMSHFYKQGRLIWREACWALMLNKSLKVIGHFLVGMGGTDVTPIDKKFITKMAIDTLATGVVLVHNHPGGDPTPSQADITQTEALKKALNLFDVSLLDHVVVADGKYFSFADDCSYEIEK